MFISHGPSKRIVIFADGTGNAFSTQESNVWRLYQALDKTGTDQIAYYIPGVGTSSFRPYAIVDGATGIGVPANVRKLYEFICWNWQPGDKIYMFGFSRGSFTIRTLIGLMHYEGLVPAAIGGETVPRAVMAHNVRAAWRSYRSRTAPWTRTLPTIWLARFVRNIVLVIFGWLAGYASYRSVARQTAAQRRDQISIEFAGLFDTVEAFGVPIEELRKAIDWLIWPISFKNQILSSHVRRACHGLCLDDERQTFHPLRFDQTHERDSSRITEVWFPGVHSDVGGGYPESVLEHVPLVWMLDRATEMPPGAPAAEGLRFLPAMTDDFRHVASPLAHCHDSRTGLGVFYRYDPRSIGEGRDVGGPPVIHHAVAEKMVFGTEGYAPKTLPSEALVLMPDQTKVKIKGFAPDKDLHARLRQAQTPMDVAKAAVAQLRETDAYAVSLVRDKIWWRRVAYYALLFAAFVVASLPYTAAWLDRMIPSVGAVTSKIDQFDQALSASIDGFFAIPASFLPSYLAPWSKAIIDYPLICIAVIAVTALVYAWNSRLRGRIADLARQAWFPALREPKLRAAIAAARGGRQPKTTLARFMRTSRRVQWAQWIVTDIVLIAALALLLLSKATVIFQTGNGDLCVRSKPMPALEPGETAVAPTPFTTASMCWASGITLVSGYHYEVWIEMQEPYFDQLVISDIAGFNGFSFGHIVGIPIRRWISADWFQPIARIGAVGRDEWALTSVSGDAALEAGTDRSGHKIPATIDRAPGFQDYLSHKAKPMTGSEFSRSLGVTSSIPEADQKAANAVAEKFDLRRRFVSRFIAQSDGEFFLYVNDAAVGLPLLPVFDGFYRNNSGTAKVTIKRLDAPQAPGAGTTSSAMQTH